ncbi:MAG: NADH-quinone oxidoreductase subunit N [Desulfobacterales bacterium]|jgi:NADH-quinone oxidoreductase subunit N
MKLADLIPILPLIILGVSAVVVMLQAALHRNHKAAVFLTLAGLVLAGVTLPAVSQNAPLRFTSLLLIDRFAILYIGLLFAASIATVLLSYGYLQQFDGNREEYYILLLLAAAGATVLAASDHFVAFFLGLEILSVSLYALVAYPHLTEGHIEAGVKYLILAAVSSAFVLFGMALVYAASGTMTFGQFGALLHRLHPEEMNMVMLTGAGLLVVGIGFKLAVVPFHLWTPDVYQGAPAPVTGFVATVSKGAALALLIRIFPPADIQAGGPLYTVFALIAAASMMAGNLLALLQSNVKRILAYSSIAHLGYLLTAYLAGGVLAVTAITFYLIAYFVTTLGAFGIVVLLSGPQHEAERLDDYRGLFWRRPWLAGVFTAMLLSLAGIPLTVGFIGKFYLVLAGVGSALWTLVIILVVTSTIGLYYYLRIIVAMFVQQPDKKDTGPPTPLSLPGALTLATLTVLLVWLGVVPAPVIDLIQAMIG